MRFEDAFFDELEKIASSLQGESPGQASEEGEKLSPTESHSSGVGPHIPVKRSKKLKYLGIGAAGVGTAAGAGYAAKKGVDAVGNRIRQEIDAGATAAVNRATAPGGPIDQVVDRTTPKIRAEASKAVNDNIPKIKRHAVQAAEEAAEKAPAAVGRGALKSLGRLGARAKNFGMEVGTHAARLLS